MGAQGAGNLLFRVKGLAGHIDVFDDRVVLHRHGFLHVFIELLKLYEGSTETTIPLRWITSVTIVQPILLPGYIRFAYAGSPSYSRNWWVDSMQPNAMLMRFMDNRGFHRLKKLLDERA